jgi:hypothetical protein
VSHLMLFQTIENTREWGDSRVAADDAELLAEQGQDEFAPHCDKVLAVCCRLRTDPRGLLLPLPAAASQVEGGRPHGSVPCVCKGMLTRDLM